MTGKRSDSGIRYRAVGARKKVLTEQVKLIITLSLTGCVLIALETTLLSRIPALPLPWDFSFPWPWGSSTEKGKAVLQVCSADGSRMPPQRDLRPLA